jgi:hypothetical protein
MATWITPGCSCSTTSAEQGASRRRLDTHRVKTGCTAFSQWLCAARRSVEPTGKVDGGRTGGGRRRRGPLGALRRHCDREIGGRRSVFLPTGGPPAENGGCVCPSLEHRQRASAWRNDMDPADHERRSLGRIHPGIPGLDGSDLSGVVRGPYRKRPRLVSGRLPNDVSGCIPRAGSPPCPRHVVLFLRVPASLCGRHHAPMGCHVVLNSISSRIS